MKNIGLIGCGNMGFVILDSLVNIFTKKNIYCYDIDKTKLVTAEKIYKIKVVNSIVDLVLQSDILIFAVKPQQIKNVLKELKSYIDKNKVIVSILAGVKINFFEKFFDKKIQVIRLMPNLALKVSYGVTAICKNKFCTKQNYEIVKKIFLVKGIVVELKEKFMDLITAISGSGIAYIFYISEILQNISYRFGLPKNQISDVVNYTILGAAKMLIEEKNLTAEDLKKKVVSKGGTTEKALEVFYRNKLDKIFYEAVKKAFFRSKELSRLYN